MTGWWRGLDDLMRRVVAGGLIVLALAILLLTLSWCGERKRAREAGGDAALAEGRTTSSVEAITEIGELGDRGLATDAQVKEAQDAIRQAPPRPRLRRHPAS